MVKLYFATAKVIHFNRFDNLMKSYMLFFLFFTPFFCFTQVSESFSDGNFTRDPTWTGTVSNFIVNYAFQLQSAAPVASTSYLFTPSYAIENAVWECRLKIEYPTSSSNYACMYIISDVSTLENGIKGYFVQVGGIDDEISLYFQEGMQKVKIIDGIDKRTDGKPVDISVKVTRDSLSVFRLYSKLSSETEYVLEGEVQNSKVQKSKYFGLSFTNTATTGNCYYFDDIRVTGLMIQDVIRPELTWMKIMTPSRLAIHFSEPVEFSGFQIKIDGEDTRIIEQQMAENQESIQVELDMEFQPGKRYVVQVNGVKDDAGNSLLNNQKAVGMTEPISAGDIVFNEVMFHQPDSSAEYIEFYNRSGKVIDLSGMVFTTRKSDGSVNSGNKFPDGLCMFPKDYLAVTSDASAVKRRHACPDEANLIETGWNALNNESATLILTNSNKDTIFDEFSYLASMHHVLVKHPKGVALERIYVDLPTQDLQNWHSASSSHNYGTPGFKNSQYRDLNPQSQDKEKHFYLESQIFSPDNDGDNDVCVLRYEVPMAGYLVNITVLSATGEKVFALAEQYIAGKNGYFMWDGRNSTGRISNIGIYVFYIEIFHPESGERKQIKLPVVLSSR